MQTQLTQSLPFWLNVMTSASEVEERRILVTGGLGHFMCTQVKSGPKEDDI